MNGTSTPICEEKTIYEEISELKIEESIKKRILSKVTEIETKNEHLVDKLREFDSSISRMKRAIVMLSLIAAERYEDVI